MPSTAPDCTQLLLDSVGGNRAALDALWPLVYDELREIAHGRLRHQRFDADLETTGLVHEVYLKLVDSSRAGWESRAHFLALASRAMRFILLDFARSQTAQKRGGAARPLDLDSVHVATENRVEELLSLNLALEMLMQRDERLGQLVELRFFGGLAYEEIAEVTGRSIPTVKRDWKRARAWLYHTMKDASNDTIGDLS